MRKYCYVQLKRMLRLFLPVILVAAILFGCFMAVCDALNSMNEESGATTRLKVGIVGTAGDLYLQLGLKAMESVDSSRMSIELVQMREQEAEEAMYQGSISAFIVFPEGFMDSALAGTILPVKFVSAAGAANMVSMIKEEFSSVIETMLLEAQKGIYATGDALSSQGKYSSDIVNDISIEYTEFVFKRSNMYEATVSPSFQGLGLSGYLISGIGILLFLLTCLTFSPAMIRRDMSLMRMLRARGRRISVLTLWDFAVYLLGLLIVAGVVALYLLFRMRIPLTADLILQALPVIFALGAMSFLMYELASDLITGVLLQFFGILVLTFVSGCMYPITFFPDGIRTLAAYLPTGMARAQIANCMLGIYDPQNTAALLGYGVVFLLIAVLVRRAKTVYVRG